MNRTLAVAAFLAAFGMGRQAFADAELFVADDGGMGAWLVAAPVRARESLPELEVRRGVAVDGARFSVLADAAGTVPLRLGPGGEALLGAVLVTPEDAPSVLLLSTSGSGDVWLSGQRVATLAKHGREDVWQSVKLPLKAGRTPLVVRLRAGAGRLLLSARWLSAAGPVPPRGARVLLPGVDSNGPELGSLLHTKLEVDHHAAGVLPRLAIGLRGGVPVGVEPAVSVTDLATRQTYPVGSLVTGPRGAHRFDAVLPAIEPSTAASERRYEVRIGARSTTHAIDVDPSLSTLFAAAGSSERALRSTSPGAFIDPGLLAATLQGRVAEVKNASSAAQGVAARKALVELLDALEKKRDPLSLPGVHDLFRMSAVDGEPDALSLHVPTGVEPGKRFALVVLLHGLNGTPKSIMQAFLDSRGSGPRVPGYVLAPHAHGNAFFRGPGEREVLDAIDHALRVLPIDPDRVSISGVSMGGTGTAHVAFRNADRFSAAAPLCGYHSYFVRRDTSKRPLRPWERERMQHWSPASNADNGESLPLYVAHGLQDFPLEHSKVLIAAYRRLGYDVTEEWPDTGHSVWEKTYAGAGFFSWLATKKRAASPLRRVVKTDSYARARRGWLEITRLGRPGSAGKVDARVISPSRIEITTDAVSGIALHAPPTLSGEVVVAIDGQELAATVSPEVALRRRGNWEIGEDRPGVGEKRPGVEGPIRAVFEGDVVFSFGTAEPGALVASRSVARALAARHGPEVNYRVLPDYDLDAALLETHHVVLVGTPRGHALLAEHEKSLPISVQGDTLVAGQTRVLDGGAIYATPSRAGGERTWVVVTGASPRALWQALGLPALLPDFVVWDRSFEGASGEQVFGETNVLLSGFFDARWRFPENPRDNPTPP